MPKKVERTQPRRVIATAEMGGGHCYMDTRPIDGRESGMRPEPGQKQGWLLVQLVHDPEGAAYTPDGVRSIPPEGVCYVDVRSRTPGSAYEQRASVPLAHAADAADFLSALPKLAGDYLAAVRAAKTPDSIQTLAARVRRWFAAWSDDPDMLTWARLVKWYGVELGCTSPAGPTDEELRVLYRVLDDEQRETLGVRRGFPARNGCASVMPPTQPVTPA